MADYAKRVSMGAKFLDEESPGWYTKIYPIKLDMSQGSYYGDSFPACGCVGAQLAYEWWDKGDYDCFAKNFGLTTFKSMSELGFILDDDDLTDDYLWNQLTELWKKEINGRLAESA